MPLFYISHDEFDLLVRTTDNDPQLAVSLWREVYARDLALAEYRRWSKEPNRVWLVNETTQGALMWFDQEGCELVIDNWSAPKS